MAFIYDLTDTWNAGGTTFNAIKMNVTDSASAAASKLVTLQVGGSERFGVRKDGQGYFAGNVGIGTSSPNSRLDSAVSASGTIATPFRVTNSASASGSPGQGAQIGFANDSGWGSALAGAVRSQVTNPGNGASAMSFHNWNGSALTERLRIDSSGNLLVGKTAPSGGVAGFEASATGFASTASGTFAGWMNRKTSDGEILLFNRDAAQVGSVSVTTTATTYNTSSDYRLKDIDGPLQNSGAYIDALKPVQGSWKADGSRFIGLLAHEVQEVSETQIATGEKDGEEMQAMDYSAPEIIANLIAEVQSLRARVAQLEGN